MAIRRRRLVWTQSARSDLVEAYHYLAELNEQAADRLILGLESKARMLAESGLTGRDRSDLAADVRSIAYRSRILFFKVSPQAITILRVLHGHQDLSADHFDEEQQED
ncbi:type II toxin-antitoxin system RelE/ParE family toxin [Rhizobium sp. SSA_523]|uniref:type II toxin-antitoxin system RelE/ParE family toxin n=1 Tax=Rhizobium sp. SSA_523 TaxID=2952477 RepID=UPI0020900A4B|nr:type II toxin-antitoxin system RelE/ParE family toxin [Rhizobium sp. SSA_523]MCO5730788.1 type II toxin-antitoxin system RelE/ParE family toxin [Rhizobium sp. SSA_523]WKC24389.1 type II toxin-antitoxin system RelE/ParE family toxin [Rhizobium sp. SSA_523]